MVEENAQLAWPTIKLCIDDERDFYVEGDTISGSVLLAVQDTEFCVRSVWVEVMCTEHVEFPKSKATDLASTVQFPEFLTDKQEPLIAGRHCLAYTVPIPHKYGYHPPSLEVDGECGIRWSLRASAIIEAREKGRRTVKDVLQVQVFQLPSEREVHTGDLRVSRESSLDGITVTHNTPRWLPQAPNLCDMEIGVALEVPAILQSVNVYLEKKTIMWLDEECKVFVKRTLIDSVSEKKKKVQKLELSGASRQWQLKGPLPGPFSSLAFRLQYNVLVEVSVTGKDPAIFALMDSFMRSPVLARGVQETEKNQNVADEAPPQYSETG